MKHSKLFLTGMAALLLSFGLMMTGCDSGGDSDSNTGPAAGDYISIEETTPGADDPATAAVYTVTVKQSLGGKVVTFTNVATDVVVYGPPIDAEDTLAKQAAAIVAKLNAAAGAIYDVAYTASAESFTLTAKTAGAIANAPAVAIENYTAPPAKTSDAFTVTAGDNALKITGTTTTAAFDESAKVYIKDDGKEVLITDNSDDAAYTQVTGAVLIAATESNKPVLWVKGLAEAVSGDAVAGKILAGADVKVVITGAAQTGDVGAITPVSGVATVIPAGTYVIDDDAGAAGEITLVGSDKITYNKNGTAVEDAPVPVANDFNKQIIDVLAATGLLEATDKITVDAKGIITSAEIAAASPTAAKINAVLGVLDNVTLGVAITGLTSFTVPAGKTLDITGVDVGVGASAVVTVNGTLHVGDGSTADVTLTKAVITAASSPNTAIFDDDTTGGALNLANGDTLALADGGSITIAGTGSVVAGATTFSGAGAWTATLGAAATSITVTSGASGIGAAITAPNGTAASTLTASGTPVITQAAGTSNNVLDIGAFITIDLKGTNSAPVGSIVMTEGSTPATLKVADATSKIMTANTGNVTVSLGATTVGIGIVTGSNVTGEIGANAADNFVVKAASATAASAYLVSIVGTANAAGVLSAFGSGAATPTINAAFCVDADIN